MNGVIKEDKDMHKYIGQFVGLVFGCAIAIAGMPLVCLADTIPEEVAVTEQPTARTDEGHWAPLGDYKLTFYCPCRKCCGKWAKYNKTASGTTPEQGRTVACGSLPLGTHIIIEGMGEFVVEDRGVSGRHIDVFRDSHAECNQLGVMRKQVYRWVSDGSN
jgi:3D (Asp-Asp-Asp) domain-containing protein